MAILPIDDDGKSTLQPVTVGRIVTLADNRKLPARQISAVAVLRFRSKEIDYVERKNAVTAAAPEPEFPQVKVPTFVPCELCLRNPRFNKATLCRSCINRKSAKSQIGFFDLDRELTGRDLFVLSLIAAAIVFVFVRFGAPEPPKQFNQPKKYREVKSDGRTTAAARSNF